MKREIKFRAKAINNDFFKGVWVDGFYTKVLWSGKLVDVITDGAHEIPIQIDTLGQFTGLRDKNGKEIYEGDIIECNGDICKVMYNNHYAGFALDKKGWLYLHFFGEAFNNEDCLVIGSIYDNPELLEGGK